jgi:hypothetical protein
MTINADYNSANQIVNIWGNVWDNSDYVEIEFFDSSLNPVGSNVIANVWNAPGGSSKDDYNYNGYSVAGFSNGIYNIKATGYTSSNVYKEDAGMIFTALAVEGLQNRADAIDAELNLIDGNITELKNMDSVQNSAISALTTRMSAAETAITNLQSDIAILDTNVQTLFTNINDLNTDINQHTADIAALNTSIAGLNSRVTTIENEIDLMSQGSIWLAYDFDGDFVRAKGEVPLGTTRVLLTVRDVNLNTTAIADVNINSGDVDFVSATNEYRHLYSGVNSWDPELYNISAQFFDASESKLGITISVQFDLLKIIDIQNQITQLEQDINDELTLVNTHLAVLDQNVIDLDAQDQNFAAQLVIIYGHLAVLDQNVIDLDQRITDLNAQLTQRIDDVNAYFLAEVARLDIRIDDVNADLQTLRAQVNRMNHGTLYLNYDRDSDRLRVKGEAPEGAVTAIIHIRDLDADTVYADVLTSVNTADNSYKEDISGVNAWIPQVYDIAVEFRDSSNAQVGQWVNVQFYALAVLANFQGFGFIESKSFEYFLVMPSKKAISFEFGAIEEGQYNFSLELSNDSADYAETLVSSHIAKYTGQKFNVSFTLPADGNWEAILIAKNTTTGTKTVSNDFNIEIVDLYASLGAQIIIANPAYNDNNHSLQANTFYTN